MRFANAPMPAQDIFVRNELFAEMVVQFFSPEDNVEKTGAGLNVCHALRPRLPHSDLSPIIEAGAKA
jgi:hypothetical protein